jgi:NADPH-dependent 2,4-dienoyl-CoA reductase/sulfur reductase-like enzyme
VLLLDAMPQAGGRLWAGASPARDRLLHELAALGVQHLAGARVVAVDGRDWLIEQQADGSTRALVAQSQRQVLATGARELQLPFAGWTLPGVIAAGGLQLILKSGWQPAGRRVVIAGSGPLLLAVAATARRAGARVLAVVEQAPPGRLRRFAWGLRHHPSRALQAAGLRLELATSAYRWGTRMLDANAGADARLAQVRLVDGQGRVERIDCDLLAVGHGLVPELGLASLLGCALRDDGIPGVRVDVDGASSCAGVYAAGEATGVGGAAKARLEGRIAGSAAAGAPSTRWHADLQREHRFMALLHETFQARADESPRPTPDTLVCRCEDVAWSALDGCTSLRDARLQQRCGMGACQGRLCGSALQLLKGWPGEAAQRPPLMPARVETLASFTDP